jgi:hypothetical protein
MHTATPTTNSNTVLHGNVGVTIGGKLPAALSLTPIPLVKAAALAINKQVHTV